MAIIADIPSLFIRARILQKDSHGGHSLSRPRSLKQTIGLKTYNQPMNPDWLLYKGAIFNLKCMHEGFIISKMYTYPQRN